MYKSYGLLRPMVVFAGTIGILQSLLWIAMSVIAILAYYCVFNFRGTIASLGTITELVLFHMYFHGPCAQSGMPNVDYATLDKLNLIKPIQIHYCVWIYFAISLLWLISSITLLTSVRYVNLRKANYFLHTWILIAITLSILDLGFGVALGIDYDTLRHQAHGVPINDVGNTERPQYLIVSAKAAAGIMMGVCFRGFTMWAINVILCIYFFTQTFKISDYNRIKKAISNPTFVTPTSSLKRKKSPPQSPSYGEKNDQWIQSLHNYTYQTTPTERVRTDLRPNQAAALFEERKRHYEAQQLNYLRYIEKLNGRKQRSHPLGNGNVVGQSNGTMNHEISVPAPDYGPNVYQFESFETRPPLRSALRASRY